MANTEIILRDEFLKFLNALEAAKINFSYYDDTSKGRQYVLDIEFMREDLERSVTKTIDKALIAFGLTPYKIWASEDSNTYTVTLSYTIDLLEDGAKRLFNGQ